MPTKKSKTKSRVPLASTDRELEFHYEKSPLHRTIKITGAWGGILPTSDVQVSIFNETLPVPNFDLFEVDEEGVLKKHKKHITKHGGLLREIEATLVMTPEVAKNLADWLLRKVNEYAELEKEAIELTKLSKDSDLVDESDPESGTEERVTNNK